MHTRPRTSTPSVRFCTGPAAVGAVFDRVVDAEMFRGAVDANRLRAGLAGLELSERRVRTQSRIARLEAAARALGYPELA